MFETISKRLRIVLSIALVVAMGLSVLPTGAAAVPREGGAGPRTVTNNANDLIIPEGEELELFGTYTYKNSVQISGTLKIKPYDGSDEKTGTLLLYAPTITVGPYGAILGDGRGYGGGGGGGSEGGKGGVGGKGGDGGRASYYYASGGGGGSNGGQGGASGGYSEFPAGQPGTEAKGGDGGGNPGWGDTGGKGGPGFGGGGGGGATDYYAGGGGGGGGSGGTDGTNPNGGKGAGPYGGKGGDGPTYSWDGTKDGQNGGYMANASNGDSTTDMTVVKGSGGGGGSSAQYYCGGGGGGGAGGGAVTLVAEGELTIQGRVSTTGGGGGGYALTWDYYASAKGGGGAGGGICLSGKFVSISGTVDARGRDKDQLSASNGGTVKIFYFSKSISGTIQAGRTYSNGLPAMRGLLSPLEGAYTSPKPTFKWNKAEDPENQPITYQLQVSSSNQFSTLKLDQKDIKGTEYTSPISLAGECYWRVRASDGAGFGNWSDAGKFIVDGTPPESSVDELPEYVNTTSFRISWSGRDTGIGLANFTIWVSDNGETFQPWLVNVTQNSANFEGIDGHSYAFYSTALDVAGNRESPPSSPDAQTILDATPPTSGIVNLGPYQNKPKFTVSWTGADAISGLKSFTVYAAKDNGAFEPWQVDVTGDVTSALYSGEEGHTYSFFVIGTDFAGNSETIPPPPSRIATTTVDATPPRTTFSPDKPFFGWDPIYITPTGAIALKVDDPASGVNMTYYIIDSRTQQEYTQPFKEGVVGHHNITFWSTDRAGNEEARVRVWFCVDNEPPMVDVVPLGANYTSESGKLFIASSTLVSLDAWDRASGVNVTIYDLDGMEGLVYIEPFKLGKGGSHLLKLRSYDNLGQMSAQKNLTIAVDDWPPSTKATGPTGAQSRTVEIELSAVDLESGLATTMYRVTREGEPEMNFVNGTRIIIEALSDGSADGTYTVEYYSVDNVGNKEQLRTLKIIIDTKGTLQLGFNSISTDKTTFLVTGSVEPGSTVFVNGRLARVNPDGTFSMKIELSEGANKIEVKATDPAGNEMTESRTVTYNKPMEAGSILPIIAVVVVIAVVGVLALIFARRKKPVLTAPPPALSPPAVPPPAKPPMP
ncbi:MAG: OmpL47-type beta-barrel domain-containing protein [Thermoplasmatota archaeon]